MKICLALAVLILLDSSIAGKVKKETYSYEDSYGGGYDKGYSKEYEGSYSYGKGYEGSYGKGHEGSYGKGYSSGTGLRYIAQGSADQATSAVASQYSAAKQAAYAAKSTLAQKAAQAAATALAALKGKEVLLQGLEQQTLEAQKTLQDQLGQLLLSKKTTIAASQAAQQANYHINVLSAALNSAKSTAVQIGLAASAAAEEYAAQSAMIGEAKNRLDYLKEKLNAVKIDFIATREAAEKASLSAAEAYKNAKDIAKYALGGVYEHESYGGGYGESDYASSHSYDDHHTYLVAEH